MGIIKELLEGKYTLEELKKMGIKPADYANNELNQFSSEELEAAAYDRTDK